jgi:hypothetical protein
VPNLLTDRGLWVAVENPRLNVRRLMYQTLIWSAALRHDARGLGAAVDSQDMEGLADPLVDGVAGDVELARDLLGREVFVDELQAVELPRAQACDALGHHILSPACRRSVSGAIHASLFL